jgi:hypothetical protein
MSFRLVRLDLRPHLRYCFHRKKGILSTPASTSARLCAVHESDAVGDCELCDPRHNFSNAYFCVTLVTKYICVYLGKSAWGLGVRLDIALALLDSENMCPCFGICVDAGLRPTYAEVFTNTRKYTHTHTQ